MLLGPGLSSAEAKEIDSAYAPKIGDRVMSNQSAASHPLRAIVSRPDQLSETLECGHTINRPLGLGESAQEPSKVKRRRCWLCTPAAIAKAALKFKSENAS